MKKVRIVIALLVVGLLALAGCAPKATPTPPPQVTPTTQAASEWDRVLAAAKKEGTVTLYQGLGADVQMAIIDGFMSAYPIKIDSLVLRGEAIREKLRMEQQIRLPIADMVVTGMTAISDIKEWGFGQPVTAALPSAEEKGIWRVHPYSTDPQRERILLVSEVNPDIMINTKLVKAGEEPKSFQDLLDPKWKGKMVMTDPRVPGPGNMFMFSAMELGEDYWKNIVKQDVFLERASGRAVDMVVLGEKAILICLSTTRAEIALEAGAPVKMLNLKEGSHVATKGAILVKGASHPNAALVLLNWLLSKEGQTALGKASGRDTLRTDIKADWIKLDVFKPGAAQKLFSRVTLTSQDQEETRAFAEKVFGKR